MTQEYILQILRSNTVVGDYYSAKSILDSFTGHRVGQPISILYGDSNNPKVLFVIGKKDGGKGPEYYDIISDGNNIIEADNKTIHIFGGNKLELKGSQSVDENNNYINGGKYLFLDETGNLTYKDAVRVEADIEWGTWNSHSEIT